MGDFTLTTGLRVESMDYQRSNKLTGQRGEESVEAVIPGVGLAWSPGEMLTLFAGAYEGFSPPRVEDIISNSGGTIDLEAEESLNFEAGVRAQPFQGLHIEAAIFQMDFDNQIVPGTLAGGVLTNAGPTLHQGFEAQLRWSSKEALGTAIEWYASATVTNIWTAEYKADRGAALPVNGKRLPYAPEWFGRAAVGFGAPAGLQAEVEMVHTGEMFADELNTVVETANGQKGLIPDVTVFNVSASWRVTPQVRLTAQLRNIEDRLYIADRSRGILPGEPRMTLVGLEYAF